MWLTRFTRWLSSWGRGSGCRFPTIYPRGWSDAWGLNRNVVLPKEDWWRVCEGMKHGYRTTLIDRAKGEEAAHRYLGRGRIKFSQVGDPYNWTEVGRTFTSKDGGKTWENTAFRRTVPAPQSAAPATERTSLTGLQCPVHTPLRHYMEHPGAVCICPASSPPPAVYPLGQSSTSSRRDTVKYVTAAWQSKATSSTSSSPKKKAATKRRSPGVGKRGGCGSGGSKR